MSCATSAASDASEVAGQPHDQNQYLTFMLGREVLAIGILSIKEILEHEQPSDVPMTPGFTRGVMTSRGAVIPVIDLATRLNRPPAAVGKKTCIVIVEVQSQRDAQVIGIVVDAVNEVLEIAASQIEAPPDFGTSVATGYIAGLGKVNGRFVVILDVRRISAVEDLERLERPASPADVSVV